MNRSLITLILLLIATALFSSAPVSASTEHEAQQIQAIIDQAQNRLWLGIYNKGGNRAFEEGLELVETASGMHQQAQLTPEQKNELSSQIFALEQELELLIELYGERFYGIFPLARLMITSSQIDGGLAITEQLHAPPDTAAVEIATQNFAKQISHIDSPHIVIKSLPENRLLENLAHEVLAREGGLLPQNRSALIRALGTRQLDAFEQGLIDPQMRTAMMQAFNGESLIVLTITRSSPANDDLVKYALSGDVYLRGKAIQGGPDDARPITRAVNSMAFGAMLDRRDQFWPIIVMQLLLFALALLWAARVTWSTEKALFSKLVVGTACFVFGRVFMLVCVILLRRIAPEASAMMSAAWWWPALVGILAVLGGGLVAWIGQARLNEIIPGARGARAVGSIFALVALGATSYFVEPMLLLEESCGYAVLIPFTIASIGIAVIFGFAARTGPPIPHYFSVGPLILAPLAGVFLLQASAPALWGVVGATAILSVIAALRHRYTVAHGIEEPEPTPEAAAEADQQRLVKFSKTIKEKL
jgi:hypothetical protein